MCMVRVLLPVGSTVSAEEGVWGEKGIADIWEVRLIGDVVDPMLELELGDPEEEPNAEECS